MQALPGTKGRSSCCSPASAGGGAAQQLPALCGKEQLHPSAFYVRKVFLSALGAPCAREALGLHFSGRSKDKRPKEHRPLGQPLSLFRFPLGSLLHTSTCSAASGSPWLPACMQGLLRSPLALVSLHRAA